MEITVVFLLNRGHKILIKTVLCTGALRVRVDRTLHNRLITPATALIVDLKLDYSYVV